MDIFNLYATNPDAEENGRYFENGDVEFLIAREGNDQYSRMINVQFKAHEHTLSQKDSDEGLMAAKACSDKIMISVMSKSILLGWRGIEKNGKTGKVTFQGEELEFNADNAAKLLALKDFRSWVSGKSSDFKNYLAVQEAKDEKNLSPSTAGTSNGVAT